MDIKGIWEESSGGQGDSRLCEKFMLSFEEKAVYHTCLTPNQQNFPFLFNL
jgi:hypothetical protein